MIKSVVVERSTHDERQKAHVRLAQRFADQPERRGYRLYAWAGRYAIALVAGNRGKREACQDICQAMIEWATPRQLGRLADFAHHALAQAALAACDFEECYAHTTAITPPGTFRSHSLQALWTALDLIPHALRAPASP